MKWCIGLLVATTVLSLGEESPRPRNAILFIGDGMGLSHITAARVVRGGLNLERFPVGGFVATHSANRLVTDSAASATAYATGFKTDNGAVGWSVFDKPLKNVMECAQEVGKATGLVVLCRLTHATPAAFVAHIDSRNKYAAIADQMAASGLDVLIGGGYGYFVPRGEEDSLRKDDHNPLALLRERMKVVRSYPELERSQGESRLAAFLAVNDPPPAAERPYSLADLTRAAIRILDHSDRGFVLMVEGSQIDWRAHANDGKGVVEETIDFDQAVGEGLDFAEADGTTLILVTADHETGGFAIEGGSIEKQEITECGFTTGGHTGTMVPLFAFGPRSREFGGIHDNTFIGRQLKGFVTNPSADDDR